MGQRLSKNPKNREKKNFFPGKFRLLGGVLGYRKMQKNAKFGYFEHLRDFFTCFTLDGSGCGWWGWGVPTYGNSAACGVATPSASMVFRSDISNSARL